MFFHRLKNKDFLLKLGLNIWANGKPPRYPL